MCHRETPSSSELQLGTAEPPFFKKSCVKDGAVSSGREWLFQGPFLSRSGDAFNCVDCLHRKFPVKSVVMKDFHMGTEVLVHCPGGVPEQIMNFSCEHLPDIWNTTSFSLSQMKPWAFQEHFLEYCLDPLQAHLYKPMQPLHEPYLQQSQRARRSLTFHPCLLPDGEDLLLSFFVHLSTKARHYKKVPSIHLAGMRSLIQAASFHTTRFCSGTHMGLLQLVSVSLLT